MATNFRVKLPTLPSFVASASRNGLKDRNSDFKILNGNDFCAQTWSSNPVDYEVTNCHFQDDGQKYAFLAKYPRKYWADLHQIFRIGRSMGADDKSCIPFTIFHAG